MEGKLIVKPIFNRKNKWNIVTTIDGQELKVGHKDKNSIFKYLEFDTKKDAIEHIKQDDSLILK